MAFRPASVAILSLVMLVVAACGAHYDALQAPPLAVKGGAQQRSVVVVSAIGDKFSVQKLGIMVFGNALDQPQIEAWGIDAHVSSRIAAHLGPQAKVRSIAPPRDAFAAYYRAEPFANQEEKLATLLRTIAGPQPSDMLVVVMRSANQIANTNQHVSGIGVISLPGLFARKLMFALFQIRIYDGKTLKPLVVRIPQARDYSPMTSPIRGPHREIQEAWWPEPANVAGDQRLRSAMLELIDEALSRTLPEAFTTN